MRSITGKGIKKTRHKNNTLREWENCLMENNIPRYENRMCIKIKEFIPSDIKGYPRNTNFLALGENLCLLGLRLVA